MSFHQDVYTFIQSSRRCLSQPFWFFFGFDLIFRSWVRCSEGETHQSSRDKSFVSFSPKFSSSEIRVSQFYLPRTTPLHNQNLLSVSSQQGNYSSVSQSRYNAVTETCSSKNLLLDTLFCLRVSVNTEWDLFFSFLLSIALSVIFKYPIGVFRLSFVSFSVLLHVKSNHFE